MNPQTFQEPEIVYPEEQFERSLGAIIQTGLTGSAVSAVVPRLGLDVAVFQKLPGGSRVIFVEVKSYGGQRQGGVGFGNSAGKGPQVDLLLSSGDQLAILDNHIRWAFADATRQPGTARYALLTCSEARDATMGSVARGKQNNFRISALEAHFLTWPVFCESLLAFLSFG